MKLTKIQIIKALSKFKTKQTVVLCHNILLNDNSLLPAGTEVKIKKIRFTKIFSEIFTPVIHENNIPNTKIYPDTFEYICESEDAIIAVKEYEIIENSYDLDKEELAVLYKSLKKSAIKQINKRNNNNDILSMNTSAMLFLVLFMIISKITPVENIQLFGRNIAIALLISIINIRLNRITTHSLCVNRFVLSKPKAYAYNIRKTIS